MLSWVTTWNLDDFEDETEVEVDISLDNFEL